MDDITKNNHPETNSSGGEIFSGPAGSSYQSAASLGDDQTSVPQEPYRENPSNTEQARNIIQPGGNGLPENQKMNVPPSYMEDNRKKFIIIGVVILVFILFLILVISFFMKKTPKAPEQITLNYWGLWEDKNIIQSVFDEYKRNNPNITINYFSQDKQLYRDRLQEAIKRGDGPDIFRFHNTWIPMTYSFLSPVPKTIYSDTEYEKTFYPVTRDDLKVAGNYYGIPLEIDGLLLFYNEDILKSANVSVPATWDDLQKAVSKLTVKEKGRIVTSGVALGTAENIEHFSDILGLMFLQNRTNLTKSLFSCADKNTTDCAQQVLKYYRSFAEVPNNTWDDTLENSIVAFAGGKVSMILAPSWEAITIKELSKNHPINFKTAVVPQLPCPASPCTSITWASYWVEGVSVKSTHQAAAWQLLKYLSQASVMQKIYAQQLKDRKLFGEPYSRIDLGSSLSDNPYIAPLIASAKDMKSFYLSSRTYDGDTGINTLLIKYLKDAVNSLSQGVSFETALKTADNGFQQVFSKYNIISSN